MPTKNAQRRIAANTTSLVRQMLLLTVCGFLVHATLLSAQNYPAPENVGAIIGVKPGATSDNHPVEKAGPLQRKAVLRTNRAGRLRIRLRGGEVLTLGGDTEIQILHSNPLDGTAEANLTAGRIRSQVERSHKSGAVYDLTTPQARIASHGNADFYLNTAAGHTRVIVYSGIVLVSPLHGLSTAPVDVAAGQTVVVSPGMVSRLELTAEDEEQDSIWETSFPTDSLAENTHRAASHKKLYIILGAAGAAVGSLVLATHGSSKGSAPSSTTIPSSVPTIPAQ